MPQPWERELSERKGVPIEVLIEMLNEYRLQYPGIECCFANYLETNMIAGVTDIKIQDSKLVIWSDDEIEEVEERKVA